MATVTLTAENFDEVAQGDGIVLVDFWAEWCGPCKRFAPVFGKVDTDAEAELSERFGIRSIPTLMAIRDGMIVFAEPGALPESVLENVIEQVRGLDMEDVR